MLTTNPFDHPDQNGDKLREECGVFGVSGASGAAALVALGLHALQHRGQEAAGITSFDGHGFHSHRAMGHVAGNFDRDEIIRSLAGDTACGHVRYSTTGASAMQNIQPLYAELSSGGFAIAHNGNISNAARLRRDLVRSGSIFQSTSDTEVIIHLVATSSYRTLLDRLIDALKRVEGAYSLIIMTPEGMIACRDPLGIRPLVMGRLKGAAGIRLRNRRPRRGRRRIRARDRSRRTGDRAGRRAAQPPPVRARQPAPVHLRTRLFQPARFDLRRPLGLFGAQGDRRTARDRSRLRKPISSSRSPIRVSPPRLATPSNRVSRSNSVSSARTMSAAPSFSRATRSATSA